MSKESSSPRLPRILANSAATCLALSAVAISLDLSTTQRASGADTVDSKVASGQGKYDVNVPGGLAFSEFKGYEDWQPVSISRNGKVVALILGNPLMIAAYRAGIPQNGKPFPDGAKLAKIHWSPKSSQLFPLATVPGTMRNVDFMEKDGKRFGDSGGWGYAAFEYDDPTDTFKAATSADQPPQAHDSKCGLACHTIAKSRDYVFTEYAKR